MQEIKDRFNDQFNIVKMANKSLQLMDKKTYETVYIHRNAFNALSAAHEEVVDYRVVRKTFNNMSTLWVEILVWKSF